jgi:hypothetical protein
MNHFIRPAAYAVLALALVASVGCKSNDKKQAKKKHNGDLDPVVAHDRTSHSSTGSRTGRGLEEIPAQAKQVDAGSGPVLEYEPTKDGVIYAYDVDNDRVVYVGRIRDRERFRLDPDRGQGLINSRTVFRSSDLNPRHRYRLYFEPAR